jgi:predicted ATP-grasp superfamily ATP-dependent carboligase
MRNVIFAAPFPLETTMRFARAASRLPNVRLLGIVQEPPSGEDRRIYSDIVQVADALDTNQLVKAARLLQERHGKIHRLLGILEPLQVQLAEVRQALGIAGTSPKTADLFRNKARMKEELRRHGLPCARHKLIESWDDAESFVKQVGFPLVLKPPAGMGAKATWRINSLDDLRAALRTLHARKGNPALAEEFLRGREYSFETITIGGQVRFQSCSRYFPTPLEVTESPWIQWVVVLPRSIDTDEYADARALGVKAVKALGLETGFTHMEWFRRDDGSLAIGEIAARPPGANIVLANSYAHDTNMYTAWARAVVDDAYDGPWERKYAVGVAFLRGIGHGRVVDVRGVERANEKIGKLVIESKLPSRGAPKSDSYEGDGYVVVRDPDTEVVKQAMVTIIETLQVHYG